MRKSKLELLREKKQKEMPRTEVDLRGLASLLLGGPPSQTQWEFICDDSRIKFLKGVAGGAKTSTIAAAGFLRALLQPGSKGFVSRHDYNDLMDTTAGRFNEMLNRLPRGVLLERDKAPPMKWWIRPVMDGEPSQITFMGLKDDIVGVEADWWVIDEVNEVPEARVHQVNARLRNLVGEKYGFMLAGAFNPPDKNHWLYEACTGMNPQDKKIREPWVKLYEPNARENEHNLPRGYYSDLALTMPEDQRQRFIEGVWGTTFEGKPVYREFSYGMHVRDLQYDPYQPLLRFHDFGHAHPYTCWAQFDDEGRLLVLLERMGDGIEIGPWIDTIKAQTVRSFPACRTVLDFGDPAAKQKKDTGSTLAELLKAGIILRYRVTRIDEGVRLIRMRLDKLVKGKPAIMFDRRGCPVLIQAMRGGYHLDDMGLKPVKDGVYDHPADAFRYGCVNVFHGAGEGIPVASLVDASDNIPDSVEYDPHEDVRNYAAMESMNDE